MRGSNGSSCFGCARNELRMIDRSRRMLQTPQYKPNGPTRVGAGRSVLRGRVLSQSLLVARERRRRELGSNLVIDTTAFTSGEGHVVEVGISRRVRKNLAGAPASASIRDQILALSSSRSKRQYWTVGNRPIRYYDLRSLRRISAEAQIQDRSRNKTGLITAPGFSRVSTPLRFAKGDASAASRGMPEIHRKPPSFPRTTPSFPRTREPREKQSTPFPSPSRSEGDACAARRGCTKITNTPLRSLAPPTPISRSTASRSPRSPLPRKCGRRSSRSGDWLRGPRWRLRGRRCGVRR